MTIYCMTCNSIKTAAEHVYSDMYLCACADSKSYVKGLTAALECTDIEDGFIFAQAIMRDDSNASLALITNEDKFALVVISGKETKTICDNVKSIHDAMDITDRLVKEYI